MTSRPRLHTVDDTGGGDSTQSPAPLRDVASPHHPSRSTVALRTIALLGLSAAITLTMQVWVGSATIYSPEYQPRRERVHDLILHNTPPTVTDWSIIGANSTNIRVGSVYLAEAIHRVTGVTVARAYWLIDTLALFVAFPLLVRLYRRGASQEHALLAMLYVAAILPLTYFLYYFHPWDRLMLILWIIMIGLVRDDRPAVLAAVLMVSMVVKFDALFLPGLYFLVHARRDTVLAVGVRTAGLFVVTFGTYAALRIVFPGGSQVADTVWQVGTNLREIVEYNIGYPPMLGLSVPTFLAAVGWRAADRFARACVVFAVGLVGIYFMNSNFAELRAMMPVVLLLIPAALAGLRVLAPPPAPISTPART